MLGAHDLKRAAAAIAGARQGGRGVVWGIGAHVIKTGVSPVLIDLMERGYVSALAMNGAGIIHDFEIALSGATSEDVDEALGPGRFGMADETAQLNDVIRRGAEAGQGLGQAVGAYLAAARPAVMRVTAWPRPRTASAFRSPCTSRSAPTSFTCIRPRRAPRSARPACATSATSRRASPAWAAASI